MKNIKPISLIIGVFTALALFFGVGPGHVLLVAQNPHSAHQSKSQQQCQSACPPLVNEKHRSPQVEEDEAKPDPFITLAEDSARYATVLYSVLFAVLMLAYLRRRPPDIFALQVTFRF